MLLFRTYRENQKDGRQLFEMIFMKYYLARKENQNVKKIQMAKNESRIFSKQKPLI